MVGWEKDLDYGYRFRVIIIEMLTEIMEREKNVLDKCEKIKLKNERQNPEEHPQCTMTTLGLRSKKE